MRFDDLRLYAWVQFFPCIAIPLMFWLLPPKFTGTYLWFIAAALYALAKLLEHYDAAIYAALRRHQRSFDQARRRGRRLLRDLSGVSDGKAGQPQQFVADLHADPDFFFAGLDRHRGRCGAHRVSAPIGRATWPSEIESGRPSETPAAFA